MRICHISDTHGDFPKLYGRFDVIVHTGDLFPNSHNWMYSNKSLEMEFQLNWLRNNLEKGTFGEWIRNYPFLYVPGNHDFLAHYQMEEELNKYAIKAFDLTDQLVTYNDVNFYGFPYVPFINGMWNYERHLPEMQLEVDNLVNNFKKFKDNNQFVDVLVCHDPPHNNLDLTFGNDIIGSTVMATALDYRLDDMCPPYYLCGHCHEANGITIRNKTLISNAATTQHIIEVK